MPNDKAHDPNSFNWTLFKQCWDIIKFDLTATFNQLYDMNNQKFDLLNSANIILILKKLDALKVVD